MIETVEDCGNGYGWSLIRLPNGILEIASMKDGEIIKSQKMPSILDASHIMAELARKWDPKGEKKLPFFSFSTGLAVAICRYLLQSRHKKQQHFEPRIKNENRFHKKKRLQEFQAVDEGRRDEAKCRLGRGLESHWQDCPTTLVVMGWGGMGFRQGYRASLGGHG